MEETKYFREYRIDFGEVQYGQTIEHILEPTELFKESAVTVTRIRSQCPCSGGPKVEMFRLPEKKIKIRFKVGFKEKDTKTKTFNLYYSDKKQDIFFLKFIVV